MRQSYIYIMTNKVDTVLYVGVTDNLIKRVYQHKNHLVEGFTSKYIPLFSNRHPELVSGSLCLRFRNKFGMTFMNCSF